MNLQYERLLWNEGYRCVAGVDEVGRGALAGPLVAAAVVFPAHCTLKTSTGRAIGAKVRDSKTLNLAQREEAFDLICRFTMTSVGIVTNEEIDALGIAASNRMAMERSLAALDNVSDFILLDAMVIDMAQPQIGYIDGDARVLSIAAASIVAKVTRDRMMETWDREFDRYGFRQHRGYGTARHLKALREHGPCAIHRQSFEPVRTCGAPVACGD